MALIDTKIIQNKWKIEMRINIWRTLYHYAGASLEYIEMIGDTILEEEKSQWKNDLPKFSSSCAKMGLKNQPWSLLNSRFHSRKLSSVELP